MNLTKEELVYLVGERCAGGDAPASIRGRYHPAVISKYLDMVFDDMIYAGYLDGKKGGDYSQVDNYMKAFVLPIQYDSSRQERYVELTVQPVPLPDNFAIRSVSPPKNQNAAFAPIDNVSGPVWEELEVNFVSGVAGYYREDARLYFDDKYPEGLEQVMVKQIVPFSSLADTDSVTIPGGNNEVIFNKVCDMMLQKPPAVNQANMVTKQP